MKTLILILIRIYQKLVSFMPFQVCRFYPSCSEFTAQNIIKYGFIKGSFRGGLRILKCHPFHPGGYDPVSPEDSGFGTS